MASAPTDDDEGRASVGVQLAVRAARTGAAWLLCPPAAACRRGHSRRAALCFFPSHHTCSPLAPLPACSCQLAQLSSVFYLALSATACTSGTPPPKPFFKAYFVTPQHLANAEQRASRKFRRNRKRYYIHRQGNKPLLLWSPSLASPKSGRLLPDSHGDASPLVLAQAVPLPGCPLRQHRLHAAHLLLCAPPLGLLRRVLLGLSHRAPQLLGRHLGLQVGGRWKRGGAGIEVLMKSQGRAAHARCLPSCMCSFSSPPLTPSIDSPSPTQHPPAAPA